jgi:hypothetical protein
VCNTTKRYRSSESRCCVNNSKTCLAGSRAQAYAAAVRKPMVLQGLNPGCISFAD